MRKKLLYVKWPKVHWKFLPPIFDFNTEIQNFIEYFYPLNLNLNADFNRFSTEIQLLPPI